MSFTPNYLSQRDPLWADEMLGFDDTVTIGTDGCALNCLVMLVNGYGFTETPSTMNRKLKDMGSGNGFLGSLIVWSGLTRAFPKIAFQRIIICRDQPAPISDINASLAAGQPLLVEIDRSPSSGLQTHWVVLYARQGDDYLMLDPWPLPPDSAPVALGSRYAAGRPLSELITAVVWYQASGETPPPPTPAPGEGLYVRVQAAVTAGLRLRTAPTTSSNTLTTEPPGALLLCLESEAVALPKIGVMNQWLNVSDQAGLQGYVAAWYVEKEGEPAPTPTPVPEPTPEPVPVPQPSPGAMIVSVLASVGSVGLRLRSQPNTNSSTITILNAGQELTVLEPAAQASPKIGQMNQWLNVEDSNGDTGYVAAWYVELKSGGTPNPQPSTLTVFVSDQASAGLRLRDQPNTSSSHILKALMPGTALTVLEPAATAESKVGVNGQWLNVRDPDGTTGYVAAWYVTK
jgi:hypothetical protein